MVGPECFHPQAFFSVYRLLNYKKLNSILLLYNNFQDFGMNPFALLLNLGKTVAIFQETFYDNKTYACNNVYIIKIMYPIKF